MTQRHQAEKALTLTNGLVITLTRRRPAKFPAHAADKALGYAMAARAQLERLANLYEKHQGNGNVSKVGRCVCGKWAVHVMGPECGMEEGVR